MQDEHIDAGATDRPGQIRGDPVELREALGERHDGQLQGLQAVLQLDQIKGVSHTAAFGEIAHQHPACQQAEGGRLLHSG